MLTTRSAQVNELQRALRLHQSGDLDKAGAIYTDILRSDPANSDASHLLGLVAYQRGNVSDALALVRKAIALNNEDAYYHNNLGEILRVQGQFTEAITSYKRALELFPEYEDAKMGLANAQHMLQGDVTSTVAGGMHDLHAPDQASDQASDASRRSQWEQGISSEMAFWDEWLKTGGMQWADKFKARFDKELPLASRMVELLGDNARTEVTILDVGAGPLTLLGKKIPGKTVRITAIDPLAEQYDRLLEKYNLIPPVRTEHGFAERLTDRFAPHSFDIVHAQNCLDHAIDPVRAIYQMLEVVRDDGYIILNHHENEGENENYTGFHQWNFTVRQGDFIIAARDGNVTNVSDFLRGQAEVQVQLENHYLSVVIRRLSRSLMQENVETGSDTRSIAVQNVQDDPGSRMQEALELHQKGELDAAKTIYAGLVASEFAADALHLLGVIAHQQGRTLEAEALVREAIALRGDDGSFHNNLGEIYYARGAYTEALACYQRAFALNPDIPEVVDMIAKLSNGIIPEPKNTAETKPSEASIGAHPFLTAAHLAKTISAAGEAIVWAPGLEERHVRHCRLYSNREAMLESLERGAACAEVGVQTGYFSDKIYSRMRPRELHLLDLDLKQINYERFPLQAGIDAGVIKLYEGRSAAILATFPAHSLDWIYIDGDHSYAGVVRDIEQAIRVVKPDGVIVFNDYVKYSPLEMCQYGVMEAVNQLCLEHDYEMIGLALHSIGHFDVAVRKCGLSGF